MSKNVSCCRSKVTVLAILVALFAGAGSALATITVNSVTVDGGAAVTVQPGATITVSVNVSLSGYSPDDWHSTRWRFAGYAWNCVNTPNHDTYTSSWTGSESFQISAPAAVGIYSLDIRAYEGDGCTGDYGSRTLANAITVAGCANDDDCDDSNPCTDDVCNAGTCENTNNDANSCDNGDYCDGAEACNAGVCEAGADPCPGQFCDEDNDACVDCLVDGDCDDGNFCDGAETCNAGTCEAGADPCPGQLCDEATDACVDCLADADCDDGNPCTDDVCNAGTCQNTNDDTNSCDDGVFCNGAEVCNAGACVAGGDPCPGQICNEATDACEPIPAGGGGSLPPDADKDGISDYVDNCKNVANKDQKDTDKDGVGDACDNAPNVANADQKDTDKDGVGDVSDACPEDAAKAENEGACGCGLADTDTDEDGTADCLDGCIDDPAKTEAGLCGCGVADTDADEDGTPDCLDECPEDANKTEAGACGCGEAETDTDGDGVPDCVDNCVEAINPDQADADLDGVGDACEEEPGQPVPDEEEEESNGNKCGLLGTSQLAMMLTGLSLLRVSRRRRQG